MSLFYKLFRSYFIKQYNKELRSKPKFEEMVPAFTDDEGRNYYRFDKELAIPFERNAQVTTFMTYMGLGLSGDEFKILIDTMLESIHKGLTDPKEAAKVSTIALQMEQRIQRTVPVDLLINLLSVQLVREDESISTFNQAIHDEKCQYFKDHIEDYEFFFAQKELQQLIDGMNISKENWSEYLANCRLNHLKLSKTIELLTQ